MGRIADFFGDPLVWPAVVYFVAYTFVWLIAWALGQLLKQRGSIERAAARAWRIAFFIHILGGALLVIWLWDRVHNRYDEWTYITFYFLLYIVIIIVDVYLGILVSTKNTKKRNADTVAPKPSRQSRNPKKRS